MRVKLALIGGVLAMGPGCKGDINAPATTRHTISARQVGVTMNLNATEQSLFNELTKDMPSDKAARIRAMLLERGGVVMGTTEREQKLITAIYKSMQSRSSRARGEKPSGPPPPSAENSWAPKGDDWILINSVLNRFPERARARLRQDLLRTDVVVSKKEDPEIQRILDLIYERRLLRMNEAIGPEWK